MYRVRHLRRCLPKRRYFSRLIRGMHYAYKRLPMGAFFVIVSFFLPTDLTDCPRMILKTIELSKLSYINCLSCFFTRIMFKRQLKSFCEAIVRAVRDKNYTSIKINFFFNNNDDNLIQQLPRQSYGEADRSRLCRDKNILPRHGNQHHYPCYLWALKANPIRVISVQSVGNRNMLNP